MKSLKHAKRGDTLQGFHSYLEHCCEESSSIGKCHVTLNATNFREFDVLLKVSDICDDGDHWIVLSCHSEDNSIFHIPYSTFYILYSIFYILYSIFHIPYGRCLNILLLLWSIRHILAPNEWFLNKTWTKWKHGMQTWLIGSCVLGYGEC